MMITFFSVSGKLKRQLRYGGKGMGGSHVSKSKFTVKWKKERILLGFRAHFPL